MIDLRRNSNLPGLLVSVRNEAEALTALTAGADVIDVKEPDRGSLGAADSTTIAAVVRAIGGRATVTAAMGELIDVIGAGSLSNLTPVPTGVVLFKLGLAGCARRPDRKADWRDAISQLRGNGSTAPQAVAVVYADWQAASAPPPDEVLDAAVEFRCPALLVDTWSKTDGDLFTHWPTAELEAFIHRVRSQQLAIVLAGALAGETFARAVRLNPDLVAVRGAACVQGRGGSVSEEKVRLLKNSLASAVTSTPAATTKE